MADGLTTELAFAGVVTGVTCFLLLRRTLPAVVALLVATVRVGLPVLYFARFYDGTWTFLDDVSYVDQGRALLLAGYDPFTVFFHKTGLTMLFAQAGGIHILYVWWNQLAQYLFGPHYYSTVLLNVALSVLAASLLHRFALRAGFTRGYAQGLQLFFLLHWDILSWTSFINLKDVLVLTLSLGALLLLLDVADTDQAPRRRVRAGVGVGAISFVMLWIRFYAPVLILGAFGLWVLLQRRGLKKLLIVGAAAMAAIALVPTQMIPAAMLRFSPSGILAGSVRFLLTPQPWSIENAYRFLLFPSILHWILFAPSLFGAALLWRHRPAARLLLIYLAVVVFVYAVVPELQGPRQRMQAVFVLVWMQFHVLYALAVRIAPKFNLGVAAESRPLERLRWVAP